MNSLEWQERLQCLCNRFSRLGMGADLAALPTIELWNVYSFLHRLAGEE